ncbi:phosphoribosyltransferase [Arthrobacter gandavensis]|uniref:phosphoribosyltransferase n=1 Tax=Arthrobacter gandavensis TaxID=169960 RepID=UPI001890AE0E|nr:phosphoribosyltransferase family protein [Arthrobacter gandavensis]MBF4994278.1 phosphoribosyltransferase [Arthrobacter gandavensis]
MAVPATHPFPYADRADAGRVLAGALEEYRGRPGLLVLGLPRGGVPVAAEVAGALGGDLDVVLVRKIGHPRQPELAAGAVAEAGGTSAETWNETIVDAWLSFAGARGQAELDTVLAAERKELQRRAERFRGGRSVQDIRGRTVIVVDDGIATGATMRAALEAVRSLDPGWLVAAAPMSCDRADALTAVADDVVLPWPDSGLPAVGAAYLRFGQTSEDEVRALLGIA